MTGAEWIAHERARQQAQEGYDAAHDDKHTRGEIAQAADCYLSASIRLLLGLRPLDATPMAWPFEPASWKSSANDPVDDLVKAGALIAAEIDRIQRKNGVREIDNMAGAGGFFEGLDL